MSDPAPRPWTTFEHRCDRCGSESFFRMSKLSGDDTLQLFFCGHHGNKVVSVVEAQGWFAEDYTYTINTAPSISANAIAD
jgi:hypothetical protein